MIAIDTSVLVRYLAQDDAVQSPLASGIIEALTAEAPGFIPVVVLVETVWVLAKAYKTPRQQIAATLETLLRARELAIEKADVAYLALATYRSTNAGFADALIAHGARLAGCSETLTFDKVAAPAAGMRLLEGP